MYYRCEYIDNRRKKIPPRSLVVGSPGKVVRELSDYDFMLIQGSIEVYVQKGKEYIDILSQLKNK